MVILIAGDTHTGKTFLAQKLLEKYKYPYISIDHLKMGLIRSGLCPLSPESSDQALTDYLWPLVREMVKTCIENSQNLVVEGCYIPFGWEEEFATEYRKHIRYVCLIFSPAYIARHLTSIQAYESITEKRMPQPLFPEEMSRTNQYNLQQCQARNYRYILIDEEYPTDILAETEKELESPRTRNNLKTR